MHIYVIFDAAVRKYTFFACISREPFLALFVAFAHCGSSGRCNMCCVLAFLLLWWTRQLLKVAVSTRRHAHAAFLLRYLPRLEGLAFARYLRHFPPKSPRSGFGVIFSVRAGLNLTLFDVGATILTNFAKHCQAGFDAI